MVKQLEKVVDTTQGEVTGMGPAPSDENPTSVHLKRFGLLICANAQHKT